MMAGHSRMDRLIRRVAIGAALLSAAVLLTTVALAATPTIKQRLGFASSSRPLAYAVGQRVDVPAAFYASRDRTVLVFASGDCGPSVRSAAALFELATDLRGSTAGFLLITPTTMRVDQESLVRSIGLIPSETTSLDVTKLRVDAVPAAVVVDRVGRVLFSREGYIDGSARADIEAAATSTP